jgi:hypothetical protein
LFLEFVLQGITDNALSRPRSAARINGVLPFAVGTVKISAVVQKNLRRLRVPDGDNDTLNRTSVSHRGKDPTDKAVA